MFWRACNYDRGLINIYLLEDLLWLSWWRAGTVIYLPLKCAERGVVKPDKTVNLKVHCGITNVIIMACAEQPSVFLESSLDDSCGPCFHSSCPGWVMVCWPEHGISQLLLFVQIWCSTPALSALSWMSQISAFRGQKCTGLAEWSWEELC